MKDLSKREFVKRGGVFSKMFYYIGSIKLIPRYSSTRGIYNYEAKLRRFHPATWIVLLISLLICGVNKETLHEIKTDTVWW